MARLLLALVAHLALAAPLGAAVVDGMPIHSTSSGSGPTIVFVHGWTCDSSSWASQVLAFGDRYRVITLDLPGHGRSGSPADGKFSADLFARAVEAVRAEAGAERVVLVGHSMGAPVIRQYALQYPERVAGLVAVDGPLDMRAFGVQGGAPPTPPPLTGPEGLKARETMIRSMFIPETAPALQEQILKMMLGAPEATAIGAMNAMFDPALRTPEVIRAPALAVYAGTARPPPVETMREVVPRVAITQVPGTGHFLMMEKPEEFNRLLAAFLDEIDF